MTELCLGGRPIQTCRAMQDHPDNQFLVGKTPGWHCVECNIPPGTHGSIIAVDRSFVRTGLQTEKDVGKSMEKGHPFEE